MPITPFRSMLLLCLTLSAAGAGATPPRRIVSLNLCADQYLVALADPGQIAALTTLARDPEMSPVAAQAARLPVSRGAAEDVLALDPDLVVGVPPRRLEATARLAGRRLPMLDLPPAENYRDIVAQIRMVARAVGHGARGEALIARMNEALAALPPAAQHPVAADYQRRGFLTGSGTLIDDLMRRVGLRNLAKLLHRPALSSLSIEQLVAAQPDYLLVASGRDRIADRGTELLGHPALASIRRLRLPQAWTVCGGPTYVLAARSLARQLRARR